MQTLYGHTSFVYCVRVLPTTTTTTTATNGNNDFELISSGEDSSVRVWRAGQCIQTLMHPAISIWSVCALENGDIVSGASDHLVRIFTRADGRKATEEELKVWRAAVEQRTVSAQTMGGVDPNQVKDVTALQQPGKDQQVIMDLLRPERIGVELSEEFQLHPEQSTSAIIVHHPEAKYFNAS